MNATMTADAQVLACNPGQLSGLGRLSQEGIASSVLWIRPRRDHRNVSYPFILDARRVACAPWDALHDHTASDRAAFFQLVSQNAITRGLTGNLFEPLVYSTLTSGPRSSLPYQVPARRPHLSCPRKQSPDCRFDVIDGGALVIVVQLEFGRDGKRYSLLDSFHTQCRH
jgi:hypothetical protein